MLHSNCVAATAAASLPSCCCHSSTSLPQCVTAVMCRSSHVAVVALLPQQWQRCCRVVAAALPPQQHRCRRIVALLPQQHMSYTVAALPLSHRSYSSGKAAFSLLTQQPRCHHSSRVATVSSPPQQPQRCRRVVATAAATPPPHCFHRSHDTIFTSLSQQPRHRRSPPSS